MQLLRIEQEGAFASLAGGSPNAARPDDDGDMAAREMRQVTELVSNVTRWRRRLDYTISELAKKSAADLDPGMRQVLRVAMYELCRDEHALPPHALSEHVEIVKAVVHEGAAAFANGVLRAATRRMALGTLPLPLVDESLGPTKALARQLAICHSHPTWMVYRWVKRFGYKGAVQLMEHYNSGRPSYSVRLNTRHIATTEELAVDGAARPTSVPQLLDQLADVNVDATASPYLPHDFVRVRSGLQTILANGLVSSGQCSIQDESAGLVVALLDPQPGERILDACAAPGGKTLYAAMRMKGQGSITALDVSRARLVALQRAVAAAGVEDVVTTVVGQGLVEFADEAAAKGRRFDRVLVDAPCSGTGVLGKRADMRWRRLGEDIPELTALQDELLDAAARLVVPGGVLVYSTCSIEGDEDEGRVTAFLQRHPGWVIEAPLTVPTTSTSTSPTPGHDVPIGSMALPPGITAASQGSAAATHGTAGAPERSTNTVHGSAPQQGVQPSTEIPPPATMLTCGIPRDERLIATQEGQASTIPANGGGGSRALPTLPAQVITAEGFLATMPHVHGIDGAFAARLRAPL